MSSFGFAIALAYLIIGKFPEYIKNKAVCEKTSFLLLITILLLFSIRTVSRNVVWKDNFTLFTSDVDIARNSVKCNIAAGGEWMKQAEKEADSSDRKIIYEKSLVYLEKAIQLYPKATNGLILYGNALATFKKEPKQAIEQYMKVLSYDPYENNAFGNSIKVLNSLDNKKELDYKIGKYIRLWEINRESNEVNYALGKLYGQFKGNLDSSCFFLERSVALAPNDVAAYKDLGIVYSLKGDYLKSIEMFSKARSIAPEDQSILQNIMITNQIMQLNKKNKPN
jgi:tetratricopeptide (TPR) repeat protein